MIYWITGRKNAGKTTLAYKLQKSLRQNWSTCSVVLDGDDVRSYFPAGYSDRDRNKNIMRIIKLAQLIEKQGLVPIVAAVTPYMEMRELAREFFDDFRLIYIPGGELWEGTRYDEPPEEMRYKTYNWKMSVEEIV